MNKLLKLAVFAGLGYFLYKKFMPAGKMNPVGMNIAGLGKVTRNRADLRAMWNARTLQAKRSHARIDRPRVF